jgi:hypothetical protein
MDISEHTSLLFSDIQNQQDKTQQTLNTEQMISCNDSNQLILFEEQDTNDLLSSLVVACGMIWLWELSSCCPFIVFEYSRQTSPVLLSE